MPFQSVFAKDADGLSHVADLVHLGKVRRNGGIILRGEARDHIAQPHHRPQYALFQDEVEHAQEQQGGCTHHDFRHEPQSARRFGCLADDIFRPLVQHILELADLGGDPIQFAAIFVTEEDGARGFPVAPLGSADCRFLLIRQRFGPVQSLLQRCEFADAGPTVAQMGDTLLDGAERLPFPPIGDDMRRIARNHISARLFGLPVGVFLQRGGHLVENSALFDGRPFLLLRAGRHQHDRTRSQGEGHGGAISIVGDGG